MIYIYRLLWLGMPKNENHEVIMPIDGKKIALGNAPLPS